MVFLDNFAGYTTIGHGRISQQAIESADCLRKNKQTSLCSSGNKGFDIRYIRGHLYTK